MNLHFRHKHTGDHTLLEEYVMEHAEQLRRLVTDPAANLHVGLVRHANGDPQDQYEATLRLVVAGAGPFTASAVAHDFQAAASRALAKLANQARRLHERAHDRH